jgi:hypothetical protein
MDRALAAPICTISEEHPSARHGPALKPSVSRLLDLLQHGEPVVDTPYSAIYTQFYEKSVVIGAPTGPMAAPATCSSPRRPETRGSKIEGGAPTTDSLSGLSTEAGCYACEAVSHRITLVVAPPGYR